MQIADRNQNQSWAWNNTEWIKNQLQKNCELFIIINKTNDRRSTILRSSYECIIIKQANKNRDRYDLRVLHFVYESLRLHLGRTIKNIGKKVFITADNEFKFVCTFYERIIKEKKNIRRTWLNVEKHSMFTFIDSDRYRNVWYND